MPDQIFTSSWIKPMKAKRLCRTLLMGFLLTAGSSAASERKADDLPVILVALLKAPEFDEPALATTSGDDNIIYRLVHRLVPGGG